MLRTFLAALIAMLSIGGVTSAFGADLPDPKLTPGVVRSDLDPSKVCKIKWGKDKRLVTAAMKRHVAEAYHFTPKDCPSGKVEYDHLISRELLGADDERNLWPECYEKPVAGKRATDTREMGAHHKDRLENLLHAEVCAGRMKLEDAQAEIRTDWIGAYRRYLGEP